MAQFKLFLSIFVVFASGCVSRSSVPTKNFVEEKVLPLSVLIDKACLPSEQSPLQISPAVIGQMEFMESLRKFLAPKVWPKFSEFSGPLLIFHDTGQFMVNSDGRLPLGFEPTGIVIPQFSGVVYRATKKINFFGNEASEQEWEEINRDIIVFAAITPFEINEARGQYVTPTASIDSFTSMRRKLPKNTDFVRWMKRVWHEIFHLYERSQTPTKLFYSGNFDKKAWNQLPESVKFREMIKDEWQILFTAIMSPQQAERKEIVCQKFLPARIRRYKKFGDSFKKWEQEQEFLEGTARYVEFQMAIEARKILNQTSYSSRMNSCGLELNPQESINPDGLLDFVKWEVDQTFPYVSGMALGLLMDRVDASWKEKIFTTPNFYMGLVKSYCDKESF